MNCYRCVTAIWIHWHMPIDSCTWWLWEEVKVKSSISFPGVGEGFEACRVDCLSNSICLCRWKYGFIQLVISLVVMPGTFTSLFKSSGFNRDTSDSQERFGGFWAYWQFTKQEDSMNIFRCMVNPFRFYVLGFEVCVLQKGLRQYNCGCACSLAHFFDMLVIV